MTRSRFIRFVTHIRTGLRLCRERIIHGQAKAPKLLEGTPQEAINLTEVPPNDLDYYAYELGRLHHVAIGVSKIFGEPQEVVDAITNFEVAIPHLKETRDPLTHPSDNDELDDVSWLGSLVRLSQRRKSKHAAPDDGPIPPTSDRGNRESRMSGDKRRPSGSRFSRPRVGRPARR